MHRNLARFTPSAHGSLGHAQYLRGLRDFDILTQLGHSTPTDSRHWMRARQIVYQTLQYGDSTPENRESGRFLSKSGEQCGARDAGEPLI